MQTTSFKSFCDRFVKFALNLRFAETGIGIRIIKKTNVHSKVIINTIGKS